MNNLTVGHCFIEGLLASWDEKVLWSVSNLRFRQVNYFKWDMLYPRHQVDMRITTIRHWKYKRKGLPVGSMHSGNLRQDNPRPRRLEYPKAEMDIVFRGRDGQNILRVF